MRVEELGVNDVAVRQAQHGQIAVQRVANQQRLSWYQRSPARPLFIYLDRKPDLSTETATHLGMRVEQCGVDDAPVYEA